MATTRLGVIVIGIGIAGKVRIRDILEVTKSCEAKDLGGMYLIGHVSRRDVAIEGSKQLKLEDAFKDDNVNVAIICTENERHEELTRQAIEAGKHVLVEFPLALSASKAAELINLSKEKGVLCYEEDISLVSDQHEYVKQQVKEKPKLISGKTWLAGRFNGWIEDLDKAGSAFHSSLPQLHRLLDLFGELTAVDAKIVRTENTINTEGTVKTMDGGLVEIDIKREVLDKPKRDTGFIFNFEDGTVIDSKVLNVPIHSTESKKTGLFLRDLIQFTQILNKEKDGSDMESMCLRGLKLADELYELAKKNPNSKI